MDKSLPDLISETKKNLSQKKYDEALKNLDLILKKDNKNLSALSTIGDIYVFKKKFLEAIKIFDKIIEFSPESSFVYNNRGFCLLRVNKPNESIFDFQKAIELKTNFAEAHNNLGLAFKEIGDNLNAKKSFLEAIKFNKNFFQAYNNISGLSLEENNLEDALKFTTKSIEINNKNIEAFNNLGLIFRKRGEFENSILNFQKVLDINNNYLPALINLSKNYEDKNNLKKAFEYLNKALKVDPENMNSLSSLIHLKLKLGEWDNLENFKEKLFELCRKFKKKTIQPFYSLLLKDDANLHKTIAEKWSKKYSQNSFTSKNITIKKDKISLGYFSSNFKDHAIQTLTVNLYENHNKEKFELYGFNLSKLNTIEKLDIKMLKNFKEFIDCGHKSDTEIKDICDNLQIDIAIDLNGYTTGGRPSIFKNKSAPIQINYIGYPGTMGNLSYDYIIADRVVIPKSSYEAYTEKIIFMPNSYLPNSFENKSFQTKLKRNEFFLPEDKFIYCCLNNIGKINRDIVDIWSKILKSTENTVLWLLIPNNSLQFQNILKEFEKNDVNASRILSSEKTEYKKHLERFQLADLFLDTYPYCGHTTSIEALSAELPIITLQGSSFQSRVSSSLLKNLDLDELICKNKEDYLNLAIELYENQEKLKFIKAKLSKQKKISRIFNNKIYTKNLEKGYLEAYDKFVNQKSTSNIYI